MKKINLYSVIILLLITYQNSNSQTKIDKPNIVLIYLDDLGYGDVAAYGATALETPNMDMLINNGIKFTNGYASSATCSPSRYALLTGSYPWRNKKAQILTGTAPLLINNTQITLPKMLQKQGYNTGVVGKWHLGLGSGTINWNAHISPGPNEVGFDFSYIMAATQDRVPTVYIKNGEVVGLDPADSIEVDYEKNFPGEPTGKENPEMLKVKWHNGHNNSIINGIPRIGFMKGGERAKWVDEDMTGVFLDQAQQYIRRNKNESFFLYYALQQPHVPRTPNSKFVGSTEMGPRGDVIVEADWAIGQLLQTLEEEGLMEKTLIIFSSDNGPVLNDGYYDDAVEKLGGHTPSGLLRGGKYSLFEAGTRVPFATFWKGQIKPKKTDALVSQLDLFSSLASLVGSDVRGKDSQNLIDVFLGKNNKGRNELILEATGRTALRKDRWILIPPHEGPAVSKFVNIELGNSAFYQLYNLENDISQEYNLAEDNPKTLKKMIDAYKTIMSYE